MRFLRLKQAFAFFAAMMAVQLVWAVFFMPETKGGTIEDISSTIHPHPTVSESVYEAAHDFEGLCCHALPKKK